MTTTLDDFDPTDKQREILRKAFLFMDAGRVMSFEDLKSSLSYGHKVSKQAISCSLKFLQKRGAIELVYGDSHGPYRSGVKVFIKPTPEAYRRFRLTGAL